MPHATPDLPTRALRRSAPIFAALGDRTRLDLIARLSDGRARSITALSEHAPTTRQAVTKHLRVLQHAGIVRATRRGRERLFELNAAPLDEARAALDAISRQWDVALARLKAMVEADPDTRD